MHKSTVEGKSSSYRLSDSRTSSRMRSLSDVSRTKHKQWLKNAIGGYDMRAPLILDERCGIWYLYRGEYYTQCLDQTTEHRGWKNRGVDGQPLPGTRMVSVIANFQFICDHCYQKTNVPDMIDIGYLKCGRCNWVPASSDECSVAWEVQLTQVDGMNIHSSVNEPFVVEQFTSVLEPLADNDEDVQNQALLESHRPNNGLFVCKQIMQNYLKRKDEIYVSLVRCEKCQVWNEYLWEQEFRCYVCNFLIKIYVKFTDLPYGSTAKSVFEFRMNCESCNVKQLAVDFDLHGKTADSCKCPRCKRPVMLGRDRKVTLWRRVKQFIEVNEQASGDHVIQLKYPIKRFLYQVNRPQSLSRTTRPKLASCPHFSRTSTSHEVSRFSLVESGPSTSSAQPSASGPLDSDDEVEGAMGGGAYMFLPGVDDTAPSLGTQRWKTASSYSIYSNTTTTNWERMLDPSKLVFIDIEMFMAKGQHPKPIVVSVYACPRQRGSYTHVIKNQFIECEQVLTLNFWRLKTTGLTQDHYRGSAASRITLRELMYRLKEICRNKLVIHHGRNDVIALQIDNNRARQLEDEWNCGFLDTSTLFVDGSNTPISVARLAMQYLNKQQPEPHTPDQDAELLYDVFCELVFVRGFRKGQSLATCPSIERSPHFYIKCLCHINIRCRCVCKTTYPNFPQTCECTCMDCSRLGLTEMRMVENQLDLFNLFFAVNRNIRRQLNIQ